MKVDSHSNINTYPSEVAQNLKCGQQQQQQNVPQLSKYLASSNQPTYQNQHQIVAQHLDMSQLGDNDAEDFLRPTTNRAVFFNQIYRVIQRGRIRDDIDTALRLGNYQLVGALANRA